MTLPPTRPPRWTPTAPTDPGHYWYQDHMQAARWCRVVRLPDGRLVARFLAASWLAESLPGEWLAARPPRSVPSVARDESSPLDQPCKLAL